MSDFQTDSSNHTPEQSTEEWLANLRASLDQLPPLEREQTTILSLANQNTDEKTWNRILRYLLDPSESHGLDDLVLQQFLSVLVEEDIFADLPKWKDDEIVVENEVSMDDGDIDIVIRCSGRWFVAIEMKVLSPEGTGQTVKYAQSESLGSEKVNKYPSEGRKYIYLSGSYDQPESTTFNSLSWSTVGHSLRMAIASGTGQQSVRGQTQLRAFTNTISEQFNITMNPETDENAIDERMILYNEYRDEIEELEQAFEEFTNQVSKQWESRLTQSIESVDWHDTWYTRSKGSRQLQLYREEWVFQSAQPENLKSSPLLHMEAQISASNLREGFFTFHLSVGGAVSRDVTSKRAPEDSGDWLDRIDTLCNNSPEFGKALPQKANRSDNKHLLTEARYEDIRNEKDFYIALERAVRDHLPVANVLTEIVQTEVEPVLTDV